MLSLPWWALVILAVVAVVFYARRAARGWRAGFRGEFIAHLKRAAPEFEVVAERDDELEIRGPNGSTGTLRLDRLYAEGAKIPSGEAAARDDLFGHFARALREGGSIDALDAERDRARVMPRIVADDFLEGLRADGMRSTGKTLPAVPTGVPGLSLVFVLDSETSVAYLTDDLLAELKLAPGDALAMAKENLGRSVDVVPIVRSVLEKGALVMVKSFDSYDAARVLLVPACLAEGQELAAVIPDRDTLGLTRAPADGDWSGLRKLARTPAGDVLWREPLRVTRNGITPAE
jgi:hypothetical protein